MAPPDVVIVGMTDPELSAQCLDLFAENVGLTVLGVQKSAGSRTSTNCVPTTSSSVRSHQKTS